MEQVERCGECPPWGRCEACGVTRWHPDQLAVLAGLNPPDRPRDE